MVWFYCDHCGDSIKKPKLANHFKQCKSHAFTCVDCSRHFDRTTAAEHSTCVSEHEKYALGATKPGGYAANGCFKDGANKDGGGAAAAGEEAVGLEFLSTSSPWTCSVCHVTCTSRETLEGHATGAKHKRRAKAALRKATGEEAEEGAGAPAGEVAAAAAAAAAAVEQEQEQEQPVKKQKKEKREKKGEKDEKEKKSKKRKAAEQEEPAEDAAAAAAAPAAAAGAAPAAAQEEPASPEQPAKKKKKGKKERQQEAGDAAEPSTPSEQQGGEEAAPKQPPKQPASQPTPEQRVTVVGAAVGRAVERMRKKGHISVQKLTKFLQQEHRKVLEGNCTPGEARHAATVMLRQAKNELLAFPGVTSKFNNEKTFLLDAEKRKAEAREKAMKRVARSRAMRERYGGVSKYDRNKERNKALGKGKKKKAKKPAGAEGEEGGAKKKKKKKAKKASPKGGKKKGSPKGKQAAAA